MNLVKNAFFKKVGQFGVILFLVIPNTSLIYASVLDWNSVNWTAGGTSQTFTNVDGSGVDISITITPDFVGGGSNGAWLTSGVPDDTTFLTGGTPGEESLYMPVNFGTRSGRQSLRIDVTFSAEVSNVSYNVFDVDLLSGQFQDRLDQYSASDGTSSFSPTVTTGVTNTLAGGGSRVQGTSLASDSTGDGTVNFDYGSNGITSFTFRYRSGSSAPSNPGQQWIGLHDINFIVPEMNTVIAGVVLVVLGMVFSYRRFFLR